MDWRNADDAPTRRDRVANDFGWCVEALIYRLGVRVEFRERQTPAFNALDEKPPMRQVVVLPLVVSRHEFLNIAIQRFRRHFVAPASKQRLRSAQNDLMPFVYAFPSTNCAAAACLTVTCGFGRPS